MSENGLAELRLPTAPWAPLVAKRTALAIAAQAGLGIEVCRDFAGAVEELSQMAVSTARRPGVLRLCFWSEAGRLRVSISGPGVRPPRTVEEVWLWTLLGSTVGEIQYQRRTVLLELRPAA